MFYYRKFSTNGNLATSVTFHPPPEPVLRHKYSTTLHRSSFDVINILAIFRHGISLKKKMIGNV